MELYTCCSLRILSSIRKQEGRSSFTILSNPDHSFQSRLIFLNRWSEGVGGLAFIGVAIGFIASLLYIIPDNKRFGRLEDEAIARGESGAAPEARLPPALLGAILIPMGQFWFAWTNGPDIHWAPSIISGIPFGMGMVLVFLSIFNYLIDTYTVYAASVLAANSILRSAFGFAFPLFTSYMYKSLGIHWASSIPAFLALACVPAPFLFYKYGASIRRKQKYSREAMETMQQIRNAEHVNNAGKQIEVREKDQSQTSTADSVSTPDRDHITAEAGQEHRNSPMTTNDRMVDVEKGLVN